MDTMNIADELIILVGRKDIVDFNRVTEIMNMLHNQTKLRGNDYPALDAGKEYVREMQELLAQQN